MATSKLTPDQIARQNAQERRVMYSTQQGGQPKYPLKLITGETVQVANKYVAQWYYEIVQSSSRLKTVDQRFVLAMAQEAYKQGTDLSLGQISVIAQKYGLDPYKLFPSAGGGGGGTGINRADTVRTLSALISDMARQLGIEFTAEQIAGLATTAEKQNFSRDQILDELTKNVNWYRLNSGSIKTNYEDYKTYGKQFLVNLSDSSTQDWAMRVAKGEMDDATVRQSIREAAKAANPWLASYIDQGLNPSDVLSPNRDFIAQNLEISPLELNLMDQKTLNLMTVVGPDGTRRLADQSQMVKTVRSDDRWKRTNNAKDLTAGMASILSKVFGRSVY